MTTAAYTPARPARRGVELGLLILAGLLATGAVAAIVLARGTTLTRDVGYYGAGFFGLYLLAHLAVRRLAPAADPLILPIVAVLNGLGLAMIYRIDLAKADDAARRGQSVPHADAPLQLMWTALALVALVVVLAVVRDHRTLSRFTYTSALAALLMLALLAVPGLGRTVNGARIELRLGPIPFQPGEVAKLLLMLFFAGYLVQKREVLSVVTSSFLGLPLPRARDLGPLLVAWGVSLGMLVVIKDLGTSLLFFGIFLTMLYVATERASWLLMGVLLFLGGAYASYRMFGHVRERVDIWLHAFQGNNPTHGAYQLVQGQFGLATGGLFGTGLGRGRPDIVPFSRTDFILSSLGEELGAVGLMAVFVLYGLLVVRGLRAALGVRDGFGKLLAAGLATSLALGVFVTAGGVLRVIPLTGLVLPFVAYGGSSMVANMLVIALLIRISDAGRRPPASESQQPLFDPDAVSERPTQVVQV